MAISDRLMSIANMTKGVMSDRDAEIIKELSPLEKTELNEFRKKFSNSDMITGIPSDFDVQQLLKSLPKTKDKSITTTEKKVTMSDPDIFDELYQLYENEVRKGYKGSFNDFLIDRREADVDVPVAGQFEDQLMKMYDEAVEQGYKGSFFDFLIDRMDEDFDPSSPMRVSKLPEGIMRLMNMMQNKRTT